MTSNYIVNLNPNNSFPVKTGYTFKNGDKGITFTATITELDTSGMTAKIVFHRSNGTSVEATLAGNGPTYTYTTLGNEFAVPGIVVADIKLYNGLDTQRVSTASFVFNVISDTMDGVGGGTAGYSDELEVLSQEFEDTLQEYKDAFGELLPVRPRGEWISTTAYEILDLVSHNGSSYVCREDNTNVEPPNATKWQTFATGYSGPIAASQVTYGNSNVGSALDNISDVVSKNGAVNLLPNTAVSKTESGVTFTVNADKTVSLSGTASASVECPILGISDAASLLNLDSGVTYKLVGSPSVAGCKLIYAQYVSGSWTEYKDEGSGVTFTYNANATYKQIFIRIDSGTVVTGLTFKPMIALASQPNVSYNDYVPYAMTNRELTESRLVNVNIESCSSFDMIQEALLNSHNRGVGAIGNVASNSLKTLLGVPFSANYIEVYAELIGRSDLPVMRFTAYDVSGTIKKIAIKEAVRYSGVDAQTAWRVYDMT